jgi:hypothetical protein
LCNTIIFMLLTKEQKTLRQERQEGRRITRQQADRDGGAVRLAYLGISRLVLAYFLSHNTIHSISRALFILPAEHLRRFLNPWSPPRPQPSFQGRTAYIVHGGTCCVPGIGPSATSQTVALDWTKGTKEFLSDYADFKLFEPRHE